MPPNITATLAAQATTDAGAADDGRQHLKLYIGIFVRTALLCTSVKPTPTLPQYAFGDDDDVMILMMMTVQLNALASF